jgi:hypothetical protein
MSEINPATASVDDLDAAIDALGRGESVNLVDETSVPQEPPPPEPPPVQEPPPAPEPTPEPEVPAEPDLDQELLRAREAELEARAKHWEGIAGRHGSELGQLRKALQELQARVARPEQSEGAFEQDPPAPPVPSRQDEAFKSWAIQQAAAAGEMEFRAAHPDAREYEADMKDYLVKSGFDAQSILLANDPAAAQRDVNRTFTDAYWAVKATRESARVAELRTKKAAQMASLEEAKRRASTTAAATPPTPPVKAKTIDEMSESELDAEIKKLVPEWRG